MSTDHDNNRTPQHQPVNVTGGRPHDGDDHQLPGIGFRRDKPPLPFAQELPAQERDMPVRGQARFLLTGLGTMVPIAAFTVPTLRRQLLDALLGNSPDARLNRLAEQGGHVVTDLAVRTLDVRSRGRYRLGLLPSLLLGALLGGGATLLYLSRKDAQPQGGAQQRSSPQQAQGQHAKPPAQVPPISGAVKEAAIAIGKQAQEILGEARDTSSEQPLSSTAERSDERRSALPSATETKAQPRGSIGATTPTQATPVATPSGTAGQIPTTPAATPETSAPETDTARAASPSIISSSNEEAVAASDAAPQRQSASVTPSTPSVSENTGKPDAATPQTTQATAKATTAAAAPAAELQARIKEHMPVLDSKGMRVGAVDRVEASGSIKLTKDGQGKHHWLPLRWVTRVDTHVHLGRTAQQVRREWKTSAPRAH